MQPSEYYRWKSAEVIEQAHIPARLELDNQVPQMGLF
jgi:hypothetical protein